MIRCSYCHVLRVRLPCPCGGNKRDPRIAKAVIARDGRCWACGTTENLEGGHIVAKAHGGPDTMANMRAECRARNRTGRCKTTR
jgi:5-methylcytosine-specific restriction endonuclease McrA